RRRLAGSTPSGPASRSRPRDASTCPPTRPTSSRPGRPAPTRPRRPRGGSTASRWATTSTTPGSTTRSPTSRPVPPISSPRTRSTPATSSAAGSSATTPTSRSVRTTRSTPSGRTPTTSRRSSGGTASSSSRQPSTSKTSWPCRATPSSRDANGRRAPARGPSSRTLARLLELARHALPGFGRVPAALEPRVERDAGDDEPADAEHEEGRVRVDVAHHPAEVLAEEAGQKGQREEHGGNERELLGDGILLRADLVLPHADHREVCVEGRRELIALRDDLVLEVPHMVGDVAEVAAATRIGLELAALHRLERP